MFGSETEDLNTKMFTKTINFPVNNLVLVSLFTKKLNFWDLELVLDKKKEDPGLRRHPRLIVIE